MPPATNIPGPQDGVQGTSEVPSEGTGSMPPALGSESVKLVLSIGDRAGPNKSQGPRSELRSPDIQDGQPSPRTPWDTGSNLGHGGGDRSGGPSHAAFAAHHRNSKANVRVLRYLEKSDRAGDYPGIFRDQDFEDNQKTQSSGGHHDIIRNITIQAAIIPTPQQTIQRLKDELYKTQCQLAGVKGDFSSYVRELERARGEVRQMAQHNNSLEHDRQCLKEANQGYENELSIVRRGLQDAKNLASIRGKRLVGLKAKETNHENEISIVRRELQDAKNLAEIRGKELVGLKAKEANRENELSIVRRKLQDAKNLAGIRGKELAGLKAKEVDECPESELSIVRRELEDAKNLASIRGKWLQGAEVFLTKADTLSVSEVIEKVTRLNKEIFQAAALLGDALVHKPHGVSQEQMNHSLRIAQGMVGSNIANILHEQSHKEVPEVNPLVVQIALQVFLISYCSGLVRSWSSDTNYESCLVAVYSEIRDKEEQAISGRWRSLTRNHTRFTSDGWKMDLLRKLGSVLRVASWMSPTAQQRDAFEQKLEPIFRAVGDLRNALGEEFTSADLEVSIIEADQAFQPAYMEDAYADPDKKPPGEDATQEVVIGTTGIGLKKLMPKRSAEGELLFENVLLAKVTQESTILEALNPSPPRSGRKELTKPTEKEDLPPPLKEAPGTRMSKSSSSAPPTAAAHPAQVAVAGPPQPPVLPKTGQTSAKIAQPQEQHHGTLPQSPEGTAGAASGPQQFDRQRDGQNLQRSTKKKPKNGRGIVGALVHLLK